MNINLEIYGLRYFEQNYTASRARQATNTFKSCLFSTTYLASNRAPDTSTETIR